MLLHTTTQLPFLSMETKCAEAKRVEAPGGMHAQGGQGQLSRLHFRACHIYASGPGLWPLPHCREVGYVCMQGLLLLVRTNWPNDMCTSSLNNKTLVAVVCRRCCVRGWLGRCRGSRREPVCRVLLQVWAGGACACTAYCAACAPTSGHAGRSHMLTCILMYDDV